mgnify:FL=1
MEKDISYSTRKFVTIAAVLATKPRYTIWDEPTAGQDCWHIAILCDILDHLQRENTAVVVITHDMEFVVSAFERVIVMANKHIIADGRPEDIFSRDDIIKEARITRPQIGAIAHKIGLEKTILHRSEFVSYLRERRCVPHG